MVMKWNVKRVANSIPKKIAGTICTDVNIAGPGRGEVSCQRGARP